MRNIDTQMSSCVSICKTISSKQTTFVQHALIEKKKKKWCPLNETKF